MFYILYIQQELFKSCTAFVFRSSLLMLYTLLMCAYIYGVALKFDVRFYFFFTRRAFYVIAGNVYFVNIISTRMYFAPSRYSVCIQYKPCGECTWAVNSGTTKACFVVFRHVRRQIDARLRPDAFPRVTRTYNVTILYSS